MVCRVSLDRVQQTRKTSLQKHFSIPNVLFIASSSKLLICSKYCILAVWQEWQMAVDQVMLVNRPR